MKVTCSLLTLNQRGFSYVAEVRSHKEFCHMQTNYVVQNTRDIDKLTEFSYIYISCLLFGDAGAVREARGRAFFGVLCK